MTDGSPLRLLFFGTPEFAVPALAALVESRHSVVGVVSQPDRPRGRGRRKGATPVRAEADLHGIPVLQPEKVGEPEALEWLENKRADLGVVVAFGQFLPRKVRELPEHGLINAHGSLLPRHRGAAPIPYAILSGDVRTGISVMKIEKEMDAGDVCAVLATDIGGSETAGELTARLSRLAPEVLIDAVERIAAGTVHFEAQDPAQVTFAPKLERGFGALDWSRPRAELLRRIRAATPWPGVEVELASSGRRFKILEAAAGEGVPSPARSVEAVDGCLRLAALDGWIYVLRLQAPGKRPVRADEFLRGARVPVGEEVVER